MLQMTNEQSATIERGKTITVYEHNKDVVDVTTGEILNRSTESVKKTSNEPDFIKLYYKTMLAFNGVEDIPLDFILAISCHMTWTNEGAPMIFNNTKLVKDDVCKKCNIKGSMYAKYVSRCRDKGLLLMIPGYRGAYEVNPFFIAKGKWDSVKQLRTSFDFVGGRWERREILAIE